MPGETQTNWQRTISISSGGDVNVRVAANSVYKTPEFNFTFKGMNADRANNIVDLFLRPIENSNATDVARIALANHYENVLSPSIHLKFDGFPGNVYGETKFEGISLTSYHINEPNTDGVDLVTPLIFPTLSDINLNMAYNYDARGFSSADSALVSTAWHEIGHVYVQEYSDGLSGHGEIFKSALSGVYTGVTASDILKDDVLRDFQVWASDKGGYFKVDGKSIWLNKRASDYQSLAGVNPTDPAAAWKVVGNVFDGFISTRAGNRPVHEDGTDYLHPLITTRDILDKNGDRLGSSEGYYSPVSGEWVEISSHVFLYKRDSEGNKLLDAAGAWIKIGVVDSSGGLSVRRQFYEGTEDVISNDIIMSGNPPVDFSRAGGIIGQQFGYRLSGGNALTGTVYSAALETIGDNIGDVLDGLVSINDGGSKGVQRVVDEAFGHFGDELLTNLKSSGIGAISSFLTAELISALGIHGFAGELANSSAGYAIGQIVTNIFDGHKVLDGLSGAQLGNVLGGFLGSKLASEIVHFDTVGGQIGSAVGSVLGTIAADKFIAIGGWLGGPLGAAIGAFVGFIFGGLIGSLFGGTPRSGADATWDYSQGKFVVTNIWAKKGGARATAKSLANAAAETFNVVLSATGGTLLNPAAVQAGEYGMRKSELVYQTQSSTDQDYITFRVSSKDKDAFTRVVGYGVVQGLTDPDFQIAGGDVYIKRAIYNTFDLGGVDATNFDTNVLLGNISSAQSYEKYLANSGVINALVAAEPNSAFAIETLINLARADELGLTRRHRSDWFGGFTTLLQTADGKAPGVSFGFDYDATSGQISRLIGVGNYVMGDTIDIAGQTTIEAGSANDVIDLRSGKLTDQRGYTVNGHLNDDIAIAGSDFGAVTTVVSFGSSALRASASVAIANDGVAEATEKFLGKLSNGNGVTIIGGSAEATILDGAASAPTLLVGRSFAREGDGYAVFRVSLSKALTAGSVSASLALADITTTAGADLGTALEVSDDGVNWTATSTLTFAAGQTEKFVRVAVLADNAPNPDYVAPEVDPLTGAVLVEGNNQPQTLNIEGNERFSLTAAVTSGGDLLANTPAVDGTITASGTGTIVDASAGSAPLAWIDAVVLDEATGTATFSIARSQSGANASLTFATADTQQLAINIAATVDAGDGADLVYASDLGDNIFGGAGNDTLYGGRLDDWLLGGDGNDLLDAGGPDHSALGGDGNYLNGGAGDDILKGREGSDWLEGGDGQDRLLGGGGNDFLSGGQGADTIDGGAGSDTVIYRKGDGYDVVSDSGTATTDHDVLDFSGNISTADATLLARSSSIDMSFFIGDQFSGDRIDLAGAAISVHNGIEEYRFTDASWSKDDLVAHATFAKTAGSTVVGTTTNEKLIGTLFDDQLSGGGGHDTLAGGEGSDTYHFGLGDGIVEIDEAGSASDIDAVVFGAGISLANITVTHNADAPQDIVINVGNNGDQLILRHQLLSDGARSIEEVRFQDGTSLTLRDLEKLGATPPFSDGADYRIGFDGTDTFVTGAGADTVVGGLGNDDIFMDVGTKTFIYNAGDGDDRFVRGPYASGYATLAFGAGIAPGDLLLVRDVLNPSNVRISFNNRAGSVLLQNEEDGGGAGVAQIQFADGTTWDRSQIEAHLLAQANSAGNDIIRGSSLSEVIDGGAGNDVIYSGGGTDTLVGGQGDDEIYGDLGTHTYLYNAGDGNDRIIHGAFGSSSDKLVFGTGITASDLVLTRDVQNPLNVRVAFANRSGSVLIQDQGAGGGAGVAQIEFADGTIWDRAAIDAHLIAQSTTAGNDIIRGGPSNELIDAGAGNDVVFSGDGSDTLIGGLGDDDLHGGVGATTYLYNIGDGNDRIAHAGWAGNNDTLVFGAGISASDIVITRDVVNADDVRISFSNRAGSILLQDQSAGAGAGIAQIQFADGTTWDRSAIDQRIDDQASSSDNDIIRGGRTNEYINGGAGNDLIYSGDGIDTLVGGLGDDDLYGGVGATTYIYNAGDGNDRIIHNGWAGNNDTLELGAGIAASDLVLSRDALNPNNVHVTFNNRSGSILLQDQIAGGGYGVAQIVFADGTSWDRATIIANTNALAPDMVGTGGDDTLTGTAGNDQIYGGEGNDQLTGGLGDDALIGGNGNDTYIFNLGDGSDTIFDASGFDTLQFGAGITASDLVLSASTVDDDFQGLVINLAGSSDRIYIRRQNTYGGSGIDRFVFADGTVLTDADIRARQMDASTSAGDDRIVGSIYGDSISGGAGDDEITGSDGNDTLIGGLGNDYLAGGNDDDTYIFNRGDGSDTIFDTSGFDTLQFGAGISASDLILSTPTVDDDVQGLVITIAGTSDRIYIRRQNSYYTSGIDRFVFADGTVVTDAEMRTRLMVSSVSSGDDRVFGTIYNDSIASGSGDDEITGSDGNDTLIGGQGNDYLAGGNDNDTYIFNRGDGSDTIVETSGFDTLQFGAGISTSDLILSTPTVDDDFQGLVITIAGTDDRIYIRRQNSYYSSAIDRFVFADGTVLTDADMRSRLMASSVSSSDDRVFGTIYNDSIAGGAGDDELNGIDGNDTLIGGLGNDYLAGGNDNDTYIFNRGDGSDTIYDTSGTDTLILGPGIAESDVIVSQALTDGDTNGIVLQFRNSSDQIYLRSEFSDNRIDTIRFDSGATWSVTTLLQLLRGTVIDGSSVPVTMGDDVIVGSSGADTIRGMGGNDILRGGTGSDAYIYSQGNGQVTIYDPQDSGSSDVLKLEGIAPAQVTILVSPTDPQDLILYMDDANVIYLDQQNAGNGSGIEEVRFDDGTVWTRSQLSAVTAVRTGTSGNDTVRGTNFADTLSGGLGNDTLIGSAGNDVYLYNSGDGDDVIIDDNTGNGDVLQFGEGIAAADLKLTQPVPNGPLVLTFTSLAGSITLNGQDPGGTSGVQLLRFADGSTLTMAALRQATINAKATAGDDVIAGYSTNDVLAGGAGNDTLQGGQGADDYHFNIGDGFDTIVETVDGKTNTLTFGPGISPTDIRLTRSAQAPNDLTLWLANGTDRITLQNQCSVAGIQEVHFADGTVWSSQDLLAHLRSQPASAGDDYLEGDANANTIDGLAGNDLIVSGDGNDTLYGGDGNDQLFGGTGNDQIYGGGGDDVLSGDAGQDHLDGGTGNDTADYSFSLDSWAIDLAAGTAVQIGANPATTSEALVSIENAVGGLGNDSITGTDGDNRLEGGVGDDTLIGGAGNDVFVYNDDSPGVDVVDGGIGFDRIEAGADDAIIGLASLTGVEAISANGHANVAISMTNGADLLDLSGVAIDGISSIELGDGNDTITGSSGADVINAGAGDDVIRFVGASSGADTIDGGDGNDTIVAGANDTVIRLASISNVEAISGGGFANVGLVRTDASESMDLSAIAFTGISYIDLAGGDDSLVGSSGNDVVYGGAGNDRIDAGAGNDTISSGVGDDLIIESQGDDTYVWNLGDGNDTIRGSGGWDGFNTILFGTGITAADLQFALANNGNGLLISFAGQTGSILIEDEIIAGSGSGIDQLKFADGSTMDRAAMMQTLNGGGDDTVSGTVVQGVVSGTDGADPYVYRSSYGSAEIQDIHNSSDADVLTFVGLNQADLTFGRNGGDLLILVNSTNSMIKVDGQFWNNNSTNFGLEQIKFANGSTLDRSQMLQASPYRAFSSSDSEYDLDQNANNTFIDGSANNFVIGGNWSDTYVYAAANGNLRIRDIWNTDGVDKLQLSGLNLSDVTLARVGYDLTVTINSTGRTISVDGQFWNSNTTTFGLEQIQFADGTVLNRSQILQQSPYRALSSSGAEYDLDENADNMFVDGPANNYVVGGNWSDTYVYGAANGNIRIRDVSNSAGVDKLQLTDLNLSDVTLTRNGNDLSITINATGHSISVDAQFWNGNTTNLGLEQIQFADGTVLNRAQILQNAPYRALSSEGGEYDLDENADNTFIDGPANNYTVGGNWSDTYVYAAANGNLRIRDVSNSAGVDKLKFTDLNLGDVTLTRNGNDLGVTVNATGHTISVDAQFWNSNTTNLGLEQIQFADGTVLNRAQILQYAPFRATSSSGAEYDLDENADNTFIDGPANNYAVGGNWSDTYVYATANGNLRIRDVSNSAGVDKLQLTDLNQDDVTLTQNGNDISLSISPTGRAISVDAQLWNSNTTNFGLEQIQFADGGIWDRTEIWNRASDAITSVSNSDVTATSSSEIFGLGTLAGDRSITGFAVSGSAHDYVQIDRSVFEDWAHLLGATRQSGSDLVIQLDANDSLTLKDVSLASFTTRNVSFVSGSIS